MKKLAILFIISSLLFIGCDECLNTEEISCTGTVYDKEYKSSHVTPIHHTVGKVHTVTYVTHPAQYNTFFYTTVMGLRLEGRVNNKQLYNSCSINDRLPCYYIRKTYRRKKDNSEYYTFSSLRLQYYYDEE